MNDEQKNFLGIPIDGDIYLTSDQRTKQRPIEDLQHAIRELLEFESFTSLKWTQYTPYFNDGDPCVFSIGETYIEVPGLTEEETESVGDYDDGFISLPNSYESHPKVVAFAGEWTNGEYDCDSRSYPNAKWVTEPADPEMLKAAEKVMDLISSGSFNEALLKMFGDHAEVKFSRERIEINTYDHD